MINCLHTHRLLAELAFARFARRMYLGMVAVVLVVSALISLDSLIVASVLVGVLVTPVFVLNEVLIRRLKRAIR